MGRRWLWILALVGAGVLPLLLVALIRTLATPAPPPVRAPIARAPIDEDEAASRLGRALRHQTVVHDEAPIPGGAFDAFWADVAEMFPRVHASLTVEPVNGHSRLFTWAGRDASLPPAIFLAHADVVPVEPSSAHKWTRAPFAGEVQDGYVWGRGALDNKSPLLGMLEAIEALLASGATPARTVLLAFGHDEEIGGAGGARALAELIGARFAARGEAPLFVLDEGGAVVDAILPDVDVPVAVLAVAEKGYLTLDLVAEDEGGHSSAPPSTTAVGRIARAVAAVEAHPLPTRLDAALGPMLDALAPHLPFELRFVARNVWLLGPIIEQEVASVARANAVLRTTTAPTMLAGSPKDNVLPTEATAAINFRLMPGDTKDGVVAHVEELVQGEDVAVRVREGWSDPSPLSPAEGPGWDVIHRTISEVFPDAAIIPGLMIAGTDSRHYLGLTEAVYRFTPHRLRAEDVARFHGVDERVGVSAYRDIVTFYHRLFSSL